LIFDDDDDDDDDWDEDEAVGWMSRTTTMPVAWW
jgi:hypothetical protein